MATPPRSALHPHASALAAWVAVCLIGAAWAGREPPTSEQLIPGAEKRSRIVSPNAGAILASASAGARFDIGLFPDVTFECVVDRFTPTPEGGVICGALGGDPHGTFTLAIVDGRVSASFWTLSGAYGLRPGSVPGACEAVELAPEGVVRCARAGTPEVTVAPTPQPTRARSAEREALGWPAERGFAPPPDDPSTLDVLFVTTALAETGAGGPAALLARVQDAIAAMNSACLASQIDDLSVSSGAIEPIVYDEIAPAWLDHLDRLADPGDGFLDDAHALRDAHQADVVVLIVDDTRFTGGAAFWSIFSEASAFSVMNWRAMGSGSLTLAHELGHSLGCAHDRDNDASAPFFYFWGYRYTHNATLYGDIMSIAPDVYVPMYSNPDVSGPGGVPLGLPLSDANAANTALAISQTRWTVTSHRNSGRMLDCDNNGVDDATDIAGGAPDTNADARPDTCEVTLRVDAQAPTEGDGLSWDDARRDLADVLALAALRNSNITRLWVADGVYLPDQGTGDPWRRFSLSAAQEVFGGFQGRSHPSGGETSLSQRDPGAFPAILSGDIGVPDDSADNTYSVVDAVDLAAPALLDGFTIRDGGSFADAGGVYVFNSRLTLRDCALTQNAAAGSGAGAGVFASGSLTLERCSLTDNHADFLGGAIVAFDSQLDIDASTISDNTALAGGAVYASNSSLAVDASVVTSNRGDDVAGAFELWLTSGVISSSILAANVSVSGDAGALRALGGSDLTIAASTIVANDSGARAGGVIVADSSLAIVGSILWANTDALGVAQDDQLFAYSGLLTLDRSIVQGLTGSLGGVANSGADPRLADIPAADFTLLPGSPAIDAGDNTALPAGSVTDALGAPRLADDPATPDTGVGPSPVVDIGAAEFAPPPGACNQADLAPPLGVLDFSDVIAFLGAFATMNPAADLAPPVGVFDFSDVIAFLGAFGAGCP